MAAFKDKEDTEYAEKSYLSRLFVYLESEEDRQIIGERWFFDEDLEFRSSGENSGGAGGCTMVIKKVREDEDKGIRSAGLVDRDILFKDQNWELWWENDDNEFKRSRPYEKNIRILCRWEIENYLLVDPDVIESVVADRNGASVRRPPPVPLSGDDITLLKTLTAADVICHKGGKSKISDGMAGFQGTNEALEASLVKKQIDLDSLHGINDAVTIFSESEPIGSIRYWDRQSRILNGKAVLKRLNLLGKKLSNVDDSRLALATKIYETNKIDDEIKDYITEFKEM